MLKEIFMNNILKIGAHMSLAGGYVKMAKAALNTGANTFQFFSRNPRGTNAKAVDKDEIHNFNVILAKNNISQVLVHGPYTLNLCSSKEETRNISLAMITEDLKRMELLPGNMYNFHPGSRLKQDTDTAIEQIASGLNSAMFKGMHTTVLLETMAGKGSEVGSTFEEIKAIIDKTHIKENIGVCIDTCHIWDGGYDIVNDLDSVLNKFDSIIGLEYLKAVHINDSMNELGSRKDRHALIGKGAIGLDAFERIINHKSLCNLPFYLETPTDDKGHGEEIKLLKNLYKQ